MSGQKVACCTCGYKWVSGRDGRHSCTTAMSKRIKQLELDMGLMTLSRDQAVQLLNSCEMALRARDTKVVELTKNILDLSISYGELEEKYTKLLET